MIFVTLNTIITDIINTARASQVADSEPLSKRRVEDWVHQYRAILLKRDLDKGKYPNPDYIQEISCVSLVEEDRTGADNSLSLGETIKRTSVPLPPTIDLNYKPGFTFVGNTVGDQIQFMPGFRARWQKYRKYTDEDPIAYLKNNYIYVENYTGTFISIRGIFQIPTDLIDIVNSCTNQQVYEYDDPYPIPNHLLPALKELIFKNELGVELQAPSDIKNDSQHKVEPDEVNKA